ncbi:MAG: hypothetical protein GX931_00470 [Acholeplasmataceae bacterium]|nr:hypothetical protein [Acholeplasmataceae bacterium]
MRKLKVLLIMVLGLFVLAACQKDEILENADKDYYVAGTITSWGDNYHEFKMEAIKLSDERVKSVKSQLKGVKSLYILEIVLPEEAAGWENTFTIDGAEVTYDGSLAVKVIRTAKDDKDAVDFWAQNKESGEITNLTPDTLFMPKYVEENPDGDGTWADNPFAKEAGTYYLVFAEKGAGLEAVRYMGLIKK